MIYFDNAATSGIKPEPVVGAVNYALRNLSANPGRSGHTASEKAAEQIYRCRESVSVLFGAGHPENVAFTQNCTHSINCVIKGVVSAGDHVITSSLEHNAVMRPLEKLRKAGRITYDTAEVFADDEHTMLSFMKLINPKTKLIICTHASNVTGRVLPVAAIGRMCRERGILFAVDAAQTAGVIGINMERMCIDYLCIAPHKGLYAPMGTGILIANKPLDKTIIEGGTGTNSIELEQPPYMPDRIESGTLNLPGICGINAGIGFVMNKGIEKIYGHEAGLIQRLYRGLSENGDISLYTPYPERGKYAPVLPFNFRSIESNRVAAALNDYGIAVRAGLQCAPAAHNMMNTLENGAVRISVGVFNNNKEIDYLLNVLKNRKFAEKFT